VRLTRARKSTIGQAPKDAVAAETALGIRDEYITLAQLLKMVGVIGTGGEAKHYLAETAVLVNGQSEQRRGRKLRPGDLIVAPGAAPIRLFVGDSTEEPPED
jgi:ribosome-associated protein